MSVESDKRHLEQIRKHYTLIVNLIAEYKENCFVPDNLAYKAMCTDIMLTGVCGTKLSSEIKEKYPEIPWECIRGMRDRIIKDDDWLDGGYIRYSVLEDISKLYNTCIRVLYSD